jgi:hypothetical protein
MARVDRMKVMDQRVARELSDLPGHLHAGRPATDHHEGQPGLAAPRVRFDLGGLKRGEDPPSDRERALQRLDLKGEALPLVVTKVGVTRATGDDQRVVCDRDALIASYTQELWMRLRRKAAYLPGC